MRASGTVFPALSPFFLKTARSLGPNHTPGPVRRCSLVRLRPEAGRYSHPRNHESVSFLALIRHNCSVATYSNIHFCNGDSSTRRATVAFSVARGTVAAVLACLLRSGVFVDMARRAFAGSKRAALTRL